MATLGDVAARAGVSVSAVSRVLSRHPTARVSAATRERILQAALELDYRPNFAGRALRSARTRVIGLVVPDLTNSLFTDLLHGAEDEARAHDYMLLLGRSHDARPDREAIARLLGEGRVDAMVVQVGDGVPPAGLGDLLGPAAPVVLLNSRHPGHVGSVVLDDAGGARVAAEHLISLGHTRIALANGLPGSFTAARRGAGFRAALQAAGLDVSELDGPAAGRTSRLGYRAEDGRAALARLMRHAEPPTGIVVANVNAAVGLLGEARARGTRVPEDLSVVAVHDSWTAENTWPPLTAVRMPFNALGRAGVRAAIERLETGVAADLTIDEPAPLLVVRESSGPPGR